MIRTSIFLIMLSMLMPLALAQDTSDWRKHYGSPTAERYVVREGITMTVFYSEDGRTCKALIEPFKPQPVAGFEELLNEIIPVAERGKQVHMLGLTSGPVAGLSFSDYERVRIGVVSLNARPDEGTKTDSVVSATIDWKGTQCRLPPEQNK